MMKFNYLFGILLFTLSCSQSNNKLSVEILNRSLNVADTVRIEFKNNDTISYFLYFENKTPQYFENPKNHINLSIIDENENNIKVNLSSGKLFILDEDGSLSQDDQVEQLEYEDCLNKNKGFTYFIASKKSVILKLPLIDSVDKCGNEYYPILEKQKSYKVKFVVNSDSSLIEKKELENINSIRKDKKVKLFQGKLSSNTVNLMN